MLKRYLLLPMLLLAALASAAAAQDALYAGLADHPLDPKWSSATGAAPIVHLPIPAKAQFGFVLTPTNAGVAPVGSYARGCLAGATPLPITGPAWQVMRTSRNRNWGHPNLIGYLERFANDMRAHEHWRGLMIGDLSQPRGGPMLTGHASHQTGLDVDIWYRQMPAKVLTPAERETVAPVFLAENDGTSVIENRWHEGWVRLLRRAASYPEVARIFVHPAIKKALCEAAQYDRRWMTKVRAYYLHNDHFHVRLHCPLGSKTCTPQADPSPEDGCGKELAYWMKVVSRPAPAPVQNTPQLPPVVLAPKAVPLPPRYVTLADLPPECTNVLSEGKPALLARVAPNAAEVPLPLPSPARAALALHH